MKKKLLYALASLFSIINLKSQTIAMARSASIGSTVTVRGIVLNGAELGNARYMQDPTAGIVAFGAGLASVNVGDSITVVGPTAQYNNLLEIMPITSFTVNATGKPLPAANIIIPSSLMESLEGTLVRINNGTFTATGVFAGNTNYILTSSTQTFTLRVDLSNNFIVGTPIPTGPVDIIGVVGQFCSSPTTGCTVGYQIHPRTLSDIILLPTGINEKEKTTPFSIYPNPTNDFINIKMDSSQPIKSIIISDVQGKLMFSGNENINLIDVSGLVKGLYSISIKTDKEIYHYKFALN